MAMARDQAEKLKRYFINADPFLWGVLEGRKKGDRLREIKALGFLSGYLEGSNLTYSRICQDLLIELGIEGILEHIVVPQVRRRFDEEALSTLRRHWEQGSTPDIKYLKEKKLYRRISIVWREEREDKRPIPPKESAHIFLQINTQADYVERWAVFAGLWFEEIEPWIGKSGSLSKD